VKDEEIETKEKPMFSSKKFIALQAIDSLFKSEEVALDMKEHIEMILDGAGSCVVVAAYTRDIVKALEEMTEKKDRVAKGGMIIVRGKPLYWYHEVETCIFKVKPDWWKD
jgi:hypothetical protein